MADLSDRIQRVAPSPTLSITAKANRLREEGADILGLSAGEPDFETPKPIVERAKEALDEGRTRYTASRGIAPLREAIAEDYADRGRDVTPDQVVVTVGAKQALFHAKQVLFDDGDGVVLPAPYWVSYPAQLQLCGAEPIEPTCGLETSFKLSADRFRQLADRGSIDGLLLCSPSNPTGAVYGESQLQQLGEAVRETDDCTVLFDAIYDRLSYEDAGAPDFAASTGLDDRTLTINGFSKTYSMTGWRLGYAIGPTEIVDAMAKLQSQSTSNAATFVQYAGLAALELDGEILERRREAFRRRRDVLVAGLNEIPGVECPTPGGAFYVFPDVGPHVSEDARFESDEALADFLLEEARVATVPGSAFGTPGHLRLSYAVDEETLERAVDRIRRALTP